MNVRITALPTDRTDLVCIACGQFRTELAVVVREGEQQAGLHKKCVDNVKTKRGS